ncbi:hypothetical protein H7169_03475 [Candidatus Gracilibacteria bacterium]|nr:hypothetical protein [Candidatus Gracilibacteria bacterium]
MAFFFLIENIYPEIFILITIVIVLALFWGTDLYEWLRRIWLAISTIGRSRKSVELPVVIISSQKAEIESSDTQKGGVVGSQIQDLITEKIYTSNLETLISLVSSSRTLIARGMTTEAQVLIIQGLSLDKHHRDLNLLLATIYEQDGHYEKAEYIYKDMVTLRPDDVEILEKLANVLIIEKKYVIASEIYKKIHASTGNTETTLYMLTHISNTLGDAESTMIYAKQYVLQWPKNPEIIALLANVQVILGLRRDAIETYKNLKNLTPYSSEITETLQKLLIEEELANNFGSKIA